MKHFCSKFRTPQAVARRGQCPIPPFSIRRELVRSSCDARLVPAHGSLCGFTVARRSCSTTSARRYGVLQDRGFMVRRGPFQEVDNLISIFRACLPRPRYCDRRVHASLSGLVLPPACEDPGTFPRAALQVLYGRAVPRGRTTSVYQTTA